MALSSGPLGRKGVGYALVISEPVIHASSAYAALLWQALARASILLCSQRTVTMGVPRMVGAHVARVVVERRTVVALPVSQPTSQPAGQPTSEQTVRFCARIDGSGRSHGNDMAK